MSAWGGGVFSRGPVTLIQSTVSGNSTTGANAHGGGLYSANTLTIVQSTIIDNHVTGDGAEGGGIWKFDQPIDLSGSVLAGNTAAGGNPDLRPGSGTLTVNFSIIGDTSEIAAEMLAQINLGDGNQLDVNPLLALLAYNGGPILPGGHGILTHALVPGSPAIDAGDPAAVAGMDEVPLHDQRGMPFSRVANGDDIPEARIDMGAFEWQPNPLAGDYNYSGVVDAADYVVWRKTSGSTDDLRADGDGDADVDQDDYAVWRANFGATTPVPTTGAAAVESRQPPASPGVSDFTSLSTVSAGIHDSVSTSRRSAAVRRRVIGETNADNDTALVAWLAAIDIGITASQSGVTPDSFADERSRLPDGPSANAVDHVFARLGSGGL